MLKREIPIDELRQVYSDMGRTVARSWFVNVVFVFVVVGIQIFMCLYGLWIFYDTPKSSRKGRGRFIVISFAILFTFSSMVVMDAVTLFTALLESGANGYDILLAFKAVDIAWGAAATVMLTLCTAIGDGVMIWRCYVIWQDRKWVTVAPVIGLIAFIGTGFSLAAPNISSHPNTDAISAAANCLTIGVNFMVTSLILGRILRTRKIVGEANVTEKPSSMYGNVAAILIESAAPLVIFGVILVVLQLTSLFLNNFSLKVWVRLEVAQHVFALLYYACVALSPQLIIFRVTIGRSWRNAQESRHTTTALSQPIQFGRPVANEDEEVSSTDESPPSLSQAPFHGQKPEGTERKGVDHEVV
ncbi:hypothetical protein BKA70DRAFT_1450237 [Coprinopsis sp. MPI-PUGE-AT-0042]|nr:hypothetical protein BKA70DRAFT_1450237 [Coprinopsis sp. MPI-PUGE-AT-0042]